MTSRKVNFLIVIFLIITILISLFYGTVKVPIEDILKILSNKLYLSHFNVSKMYYSIIYYVRLPRILVAILVGGALAISGCTMQSILKNPMADASVIGISSGASLGAIISIAFGLSSKYILATSSFAVFFAILISIVIYKISTLKGQSHNLLLILSGIAISSFVGAISSLILTNLMEAQMKEYIFWSIGSLSGRRWEHVIIGAIPIISITIILLSYGKELNIMLLGDEEAKSLGINIEKIRKKILFMIAVITSFSVCISGNIGFVGLIIPHILRKIMGSNNEKLLKSSFLAGALFLVLSDFVSRTIISPREISVGIITVLIGAPYFMFLIIKTRKKVKKL